VESPPDGVFFYLRISMRAWVLLLTAVASAQMVGCEAVENTMVFSVIAVADAFAPSPPPWSMELAGNEASLKQTVLSWVPLGTSVERAKLDLQAKGFTSIQQRSENGKRYLYVKDSYTRTACTHEVEIYVDYEDDRVTDIRVDVAVTCL
jgi:hypothetical protein